MNVAEILQQRSLSEPWANALIDTNRGRHRHVTFYDLEQSVGRMANLFDRSGLRKGDTVLVFHPMSAELYIALAAIFRLGLTAMFLDPTAGREHIRKCCLLQKPHGLIASSIAHWLRLWSPELRRIPVKFHIGAPVPGSIALKSAKRQRYLPRIESCTEESGALLTFTSGSTGEPKAAFRSHGFLLAQHRAIETNLGLIPGEIDLCTQPIFVLANLASGVTSLIPDVDLRRPATIDPAPVVEQIQMFEATRATASPAFYDCVVAYCLELGITLPSLRNIFVGGALVSPRLTEQINKIAPEAICTSVYGSTEAEPIALISHRETTLDDVAAMYNGRGVLAGFPVSMIEVRIQKKDHGHNVVRNYTQEEFEADCLASGKPGEIVVSGDHVLAGYLSGRDNDNNKFDVDCTRWHRTGDLGYIDQQGRLWLLGRCSARIDDKFGTLFPFAIEAGALQHEFIRRSAVVSIRDQRILAVEPCNGELTERQINLVLESLGNAYIHHVCEVTCIPLDRRHNARIDYPALTSILEKSI